VSYSIVIPTYDDALQKAYQNPKFQEELRTLSDDVTFYDEGPRRLTEQEWIDRVDGKDIVLCSVDVPSGLWAKLKNPPKMISFTYTGISSYVDLPPIKARGTICTNVYHYNDYGVAELALALVLASNRHIVSNERGMREGKWPTPMGIQLKDKVVGIVGFGGIGQVFGQMVHGLGAKVQIWDKFINQEALDKVDGKSVDSLEELMATSDIISVHLTLTDETKGMIQKKHLDQIRPDSLLVNVARAGVINQEDLYERLAKGDIRAGFDVYHTEPLPLDDPIRNFDNVILSPHAAFRTPETGTGALKQALQNIRNFIDGNPTNVL